MLTELKNAKEPTLHYDQHNSLAQHLLGMMIIRYMKLIAIDVPPHNDPKNQKEDSYTGNDYNEGHHYTTHSWWLETTRAS